MKKSCQGAIGMPLGKGDYIDGGNTQLIFCGNLSTGGGKKGLMILNLRIYHENCLKFVKA